MNQLIGVEPTLTPIRDFLKDKGYQVENLDTNKQSSAAAKKFDAYILTGMSKDLMGMQDIKTEAVVIDAKGMTPEQVYNELQSRLH